MNIGERFEQSLRAIYPHATNLINACVEDTGISQPSITRAKKSDKITPSIIKFAKAKGVSLSWLEFGRGQMFVKNDDFLDCVKEPHREYGKEETISFEYYPEVYASAGGGAMVYDSLTNTEPMILSKAFVEDFLGITTQKNMHILNVKGDSMEPTILDGELIFVLPINGDGITDGSIYVVMYENEIYVKRVRREAFAKTFTLSSDNPSVGDTHLTAQQLKDCKIIGEVVGQMRKKKA